MITHISRLALVALIAVSAAAPAQELRNSSDESPAVPFVIAAPSVSPFANGLNCDYCFFTMNYLGQITAHTFYGMGCTQSRGDVFQAASRQVGAYMTPMRPLSGGEMDGGCKDCHAFNACHPNTQGGACDDSHWRCGATSGGLMIATNPDEIPGMLQKAIVSGSLKEIKRVMSASNLIQVNSARRMVQVLDCKGGVVAQYRLPYAMQTSLTHSTTE